MVNSDEEDESLAQFLESEVLSFTPPDEGNGKDIVENGEAKWQAKIVKVEDKNDKKKRVVEDHGKQREETREAKRVKFEEKAEDVKAKALLSFPSPIKFKAESESASSHPKTCGTLMVKCNGASTSSMRGSPWMIETGILSKVPPELLHHILKFLSSEDLVACSLVCKFFNCAASDESLWRRLYCLRWGLALPTKKPRECAWKKLYIKRDAEDMGEFVNNCPTEFKEYYIQMQAAKRSQAPLPSEINDDRIILDKTVADQVSIWKKSKGLGDEVVTGHACSGETCAYHQIGDVFVCEKTGNVHVCDDTCREFVLDPINGQLVCTISGLCSERMVLLPDEMEPDMVRNYCWPMDSVSGIQSPDKIEPDIIRSYSWPMDSVSGIKSPDKMEQQQAGPTDEAEPFMGSGRLARAYLLGYNCDDEKELEIALRFY